MSKPTKSDQIAWRCRMADAHGPLASAMLVGLDLIEVPCETKFGGEPGFEALSADTPVQSGVEPPNPAGIPGRPPGHCPQVPDPETPPSQLARPRRAGGGGGSTVLAGDAQPADMIPPTAAQYCEHPIRCDDGAREPCGMCPPCHARRVALADEREWAREYAKVSELEEREEG